MVRQEEAKKKATEDTLKEHARMERLEEARQKQAEENARAREKQALRVAQTLSMQQERTESQRNYYLQRMDAEQARREEWMKSKQDELDERRRAGEERAQYIKEVQNQMEAVVEEKKSEVIKREISHMQLKARADEERQKELAASAAEKEMKMYTRQLKQLRYQRRDEYKREVTASKIQIESQRTDDLLGKKATMLAQRRSMRANNALARQSVTERLEKMRQSSSFDVDEEMRSNIVNPALTELLDRCDEITGGGKIPMDVMRTVLNQMQMEGKLDMGGRGHGARPSSR